MPDAREHVTIAVREVAAGIPRRETAWAMLRELLLPGTALTNPCTRCGGPHGAVVVGDPAWVAGVSYAGDMAVVAVAPTADGIRAVGIDAERTTDARRDAAGMTGILGDGSEVSVRAWTRVEAALKADGRGLRVEPSTVMIAPTLEGWAALVPDGGAIIGWDAATHPDLTVSVAVRLDR